MEVEGDPPAVEGGIFCMIFCAGWDAPRGGSALDGGPLAEDDDAPLCGSDPAAVGSGARASSWEPAAAAVYGLTPEARSACD